MEADGVTQIAAERGGTGGNDDDPSEMKLVFGIGETARQQERHLAGNGEAGALREQEQGQGPVAVVGDEAAQRVDDGWVHGEAGLRS